MNLSKVARGSLGDALIIDGGRNSAATPAGEGVNLVRAVEAVNEIHTLTDEELQKLVEWYQSYPTGERVVVVRHAQMEIGDSGLVAPSVSDARTNRGVVLRAGPRAMVEMRLQSGENQKVTIDLQPGDHVEFGIYAVGEVPVAMRDCPIAGIDILVLSTRDVTQVIRAKELTAHEEHHAST